MFLFIIWRNAILPRPMGDYPHRRHNILRLYGAVCYRYYTVAAGRKKARHYVVVFVITIWEAALVAIPIRVFHAVTGLYIYLASIKPAETDKCVPHLLCLGSQLRLIAHVPHGAAAAAGICRAILLNPILRRFHYLCKLCHAVARGSLYHVGAYLFAGQSQGYEYRIAFYPAYALPLRTQSVYGKFYIVVFFYRNFTHHLSFTFSSPSISFIMAIKAGDGLMDMPLSACMAFFVAASTSITVTLPG